MFFSSATNVTNEHSVQQARPRYLHCCRDCIWLSTCARCKAPKASGPNPKFRAESGRAQKVTTTTLRLMLSKTLRL